LTARVILSFVLLFGFCGRAATYKSPLLDHHAWRQADTASIARNFYRERLNILYPQIDQRGSRLTGEVETGLELFAFSVAVIAKAVGFHPESGRLLSSLLFVASALLVWTFVKRRYGARVGMVATFLYAFGYPLMLFMERAFMNEALLVCLSLVCLVAAQSYVASRRVLPVLVLVIASALVAAVKLPYLIVWAPIFGLFIEAEGIRAWRCIPLWLMMAVDLAAAGLWYQHAHQLGLATGLSFGMTDKLFDADTVFRWAFLTNIAKRLFKDVLGPVGCLGACAGLWFCSRERRWMEILGVCGFIAYLVIVAVGNDVHDYYQLAIIPTASSLVPVGLVRLVDSVPARRRQRRALLAAAMAFAFVASFVRSASANSWYEYPQSELVLCREVSALTSPSDRIVMLGTGDPRFLFCADRRGWLFPAGESTEPNLRRAWEEGARVVIVDRSLADEAVKRFLDEHATLLAATGDLEALRFER
jgi:hypothetical protein